MLLYIIITLTNIFKISHSLPGWSWQSRCWWAGTWESRDSS